MNKLKFKNSICKTCKTEIAYYGLKHCSKCLRVRKKLSLAPKSIRRKCNRGAIFIFKDNKLVKKVKTIIEASVILNVTPAQVCYILNNKRINHTEFDIQRENP